MVKWCLRKGLLMAYRYGDNPNQTIMFPKSLNEYVSDDHPVRAYSTFVDALDLNELGIVVNDHKVGNSEYHPKLMLKLLVYGTSYGVFSSRKLEREAHNNVTFMWLMHNLKPDHKTIAEFRRNNTKALKTILTLCAKLCIKLNLIDGNVLFVDGTKIRANASRSNNHKNQWYEAQLQKIEGRIDALLNQCSQLDEQEQDKQSLVKMHRDLANAQNLKGTIENALNEFKTSGTKTKNGNQKTINTTDPDSAIMKSKDGTHAQYNIQSVVDDKHGLIVHVDATNAGNDANQLASQILQAEAVTEKECAVACADAGYANVEELGKIDRNATTVIVPTKQQASKKVPEPFSKETFLYDKEADCYYCPENKVLAFRGLQEHGKKRQYRITHARVCRQCKNREHCTSAKNGRTIIRLTKEALKEKFMRIYEEPESQMLYKRRKARVELPFGHLKRNLGMQRFHMRGKKKVHAEISF